MAIDTKVIYEQAFQSLRHASDIRTKIIGAWLAIYSAFAAAFVWVLAEAGRYLWLIALAAALMTLMMWFADYRNRPAIGRAKDIGKHIEKDPESGIPEERRFFANLDKGFPHSWLIDSFAAVSIVLLFAGVVAL